MRSNTPQRVEITPEVLHLYGNTVFLSTLRDKHQELVQEHPDCEIVYTGFTNNELNVII